MTHEEMIKELNILRLRFDNNLNKRVKYYMRGCWDKKEYLEALHQEQVEARNALMCIRKMKEILEDDDQTPE
jgi:hypothetical protein